MRGGGGANHPEVENRRLTSHKEWGKRIHIEKLAWG